MSFCSCSEQAWLCSPIRFPMFPVYVVRVFLLWSEHLLVRYSEEVTVYQGGVFGISDMLTCICCLNEALSSSWEGHWLTWCIRLLLLQHHPPSDSLPSPTAKAKNNSRELSHDPIPSFLEVRQSSISAVMKPPTKLTKAPWRILSLKMPPWAREQGIKWRSMRQRRTSQPSLA